MQELKPFPNSRVLTFKGHLVRHFHFSILQGDLQPSLFLCHFFLYFELFAGQGHLDLFGRHWVCLMWGFSEGISQCFLSSQWLLSGSSDCTLRKWEVHFGCHFYVIMKLDLLIIGIDGTLCAMLAFWWCYPLCRVVFKLLQFASPCFLLFQTLKVPAVREQCSFCLCCKQLYHPEL